MRCDCALAGDFARVLVRGPASFSALPCIPEAKLEQTAARVGVPELEMTDLEETLAALPALGRSQARALLNAIQLQAVEDHPTMAFTAKYVLILAQDLWDSSRSASARWPTS